MAIYSGQVLRVDLATQETSATYLKVTDDDWLIESADLGTIYNLCGNNLPAPPVLDTRVISGTLLDGSAFSYTVQHFLARGKDFYILPAEFAPEAVAEVTSSVAAPAMGPESYLALGQTLDDEALLAGQALSLNFRRGNVIAQSVISVGVDDDDRFIQFDGTNGTVNSETGASAGLLIGGNIGAVGFSANLVLVSVTYLAADGAHSFEALRYSMPLAAGVTKSFYIPATGSVDLSTVLSFQSQTVLPTSPDGLRYEGFGLSNALTTTTGTARSDFRQGGFVPDQMLGLGGADTLVGGMGADSLDGGLAGDVLHGGAQNDTLVGGVGDDQLYGGNDRDRLDGGAGSDTLVANWGNDTLLGGDGGDKINAGSDNDLILGGSGNDSLIGFEGDDRLLDGTGADQINGGVGADVFVMSDDATTDRIIGFENGLDLIDLTAAFASLTITTITAGQVQIVAGGDTLLVSDAALTLTAASFTADDFL